MAYQFFNPHADARFVALIQRYYLEIGASSAKLFVDVLQRRGRRFHLCHVQLAREARDGAQYIVEKICMIRTAMRHTKEKHSMNLGNDILVEFI